MSWSFDVKGANKTEVLAAFDAAVDRQAPHCQPAEQIKALARSMTAHMAEAGVLSMSTNGHTNADGLGCTIRLSASAY